MNQPQKDLAESAASTASEPPSGQVEPKKLLERISKRWKALRKDWMEEADKAVKIFEAHDPAKHPFNVLYSNTEVLLPALFNSTPRPEVSSRWSQRQEAQKRLDSAVSQAVQRACEYFADSNQAQYDTYSEAVEGAVLEMLVPGLGQVRVRYHAEGNYQTICYEKVAYDRFVWAYARSWKAVPWVAFGHDLDQADFEEQFPEFVKTAEYKDFTWDTIESEHDDQSQRGSPQAKGRALLVWEVWDSSTRQVTFVCERWQEKVLLSERYPALMTSRFPCPRPLMYAKKVKVVEPVTPYRLYLEQAEELNRITGRIKRIVSAIRARGIYNSGFGEIQQLLNEDDDNILVPSESAAAFADSGIDKQIWFMPTDVLVNTLRELYTAREQCKQSIYEIMGIADILRGSSDPNETKGAQQIKERWGSLRIKKAQKSVQTFCLELFRISAELAAEYFTPATWAQVTRLPFLFAQQKQQLQQKMQEVQAQGAQMQQQMQAAQQAAQQGDPAAQQAVQQMQQRMQQLQASVPPDMAKAVQYPSWEEVIEVLQNTFERTYRVDVETNSTVDLEATEDKEAIGEFMNAFGQMTAGLQPMVETGQLPFEATKVILSEVFRRFRFGRRVQDALDQMQAPQAPPDPKEIEQQVQQKADMERAALEAKSASAMAKMESRLAKMEIQLAEKDAQAAHAERSAQAQLQGKELEGRSREFEGKVRQNELKQNYEGKLKLNQEQLTAKEGQLTEQSLKAMLTEITNTINTFRQEMSAKEQVAQAEDKAAAAPAEYGQKLEQAVAQLAEGQQAMMQAIVAVAKMAGAEREAEIFVGQDGRKRSRSRIVQ